MESHRFGSAQLPIWVGGVGWMTPGRGRRNTPLKNEALARGGQHKALTGSDPSWMGQCRLSLLSRDGGNCALGWGEKMSETEKETISKKPHPKPWKPVEKKSISICLHPQSWEKIPNQCREKNQQCF